MLISVNQYSNVMARPSKDLYGSEPSSDNARYFVKNCVKIGSAVFEFYV